MGRPEWSPERGITDSAVEAQAQAILAGGSAPVAREGSDPRDARGLPPREFGMRYPARATSASSTAWSWLPAQPSAAAIPSGLVNGR